MKASQQQVLFQFSHSEQDSRIEQVLAKLPQLPSSIRYYDEFNDTIQSIQRPEERSAFDLLIHGRRLRLNFSDMDERCALLFKHVFQFLLARDVSVVSAYGYLSHAFHLAPSDVAEIVDAGPTGIAKFWTELRARGLPLGTYLCAKHLLYLLCAYRLNGWSDDYRPFVGAALPLPARDKYAGVRSGDVFLSAEEEAHIVRHLDRMVERISNQINVDDAALADAGMLACAYQFAMRPIQIAMLTLGKVRIWEEVDSELPTVHLTFHMAKQRGEAKRKQLTRRVKAEWATIFVELKKRLKERSRDGATRIFGVESNYETGQRIASLVRSLIDSDDLGTAMDLRHTAAQRLVDAGASHEELAEFMGHANTSTGLVYYATSASHAERINRALGASDVYRRVARIAHDRFISAEELADLKDDQQIAGVPHGIPIAGIGGCTSGQPGCPYNPITSCYGCHKFMPVHDKHIHEDVLSSMREVVQFFDRTSRSDVKSPTYLQLQRTIAEIQAVITEIEEKAP